jgi:hypothetical protein
MFSLSLHHACRRASVLALASVFAIAPARAQQPQHAAHDSTKSKMPMNMQMGTPTKKKTAASSRPTISTTGKKRVTPKAGSKPPPRGAKKRSQTMAMPMPAKFAPERKPSNMPGMQMGAHPPAAHGDTSRGKMGAMDMQNMPPAAKDSARMSAPNMPSKPDSAHVNTPGIAGMTGMASDKRDTSATAIKGMQPGTPMAGMHGHTPQDMMIGPAGVSMERMGSGTTWIPDAVSMPSRTRMVGTWMFMAHGFVFAQYDHQSGERGDDQFGSLNWAMLMATHELAGGRFQARTMLSLDPLTVTNRGYPLLLQTGESYKGQPLYNRQHPHDFWMELGALYQRPITKSLAWSLYAAPSGEPALGPVAFMHRPSAMDVPNAPIGHHWQDATHVSFGVLTTGIFTHTWQLEGSVFNGREPDEKRWDFDPMHLDSYSGRFTLNPNAHWSLSGAYGYLKSPEGLNPTESMHRITTSAEHGASLGSDGQMASTFTWAANKHSTMPGLSNSFLLESEAILDKENTLFGRTEIVQKSAQELVVVNPVLTSKGVLLPGFPTTQHFNVGTAQLGYIRELARTHWATIGLGAAGTLNFVPGSLEPYYGSKTPVGTFIFLRLRPFHASKNGMTDMGGMTMGTGHE